MNTCQICQRRPRTGYNRPHSNHRTKRKIYPNIQKINGKHICMGCLRTITNNKISKAKKA